MSLVCPDSEWLDVRRNVFELGGKLPSALRKGLEATIRGAAAPRGCRCRCRDFRRIA